MFDKKWQNLHCGPGHMRILGNVRHYVNCTMRSHYDLKLLSGTNPFKYFWYSRSVVFNLLGVCNI